MIRINLLSVRQIKADIGRLRELVIAGISLGLAVALMIIVQVYQTIRIYALEKEQESLSQEIERLNAQSKLVQDLEQKVKALKDKLNVIDDLSKKKVGPVRVMESLSLAIPQRLWLTEFRESGGSLTLNGMALDNQSIADFHRALAASPYFRDVDLVETSHVEQQGGAPLKKFTLRSRLLYQPPPPPAQKAGPAPPTKDGGKR